MNHELDSSYYMCRQNMRARSQTGQAMIEMMLLIGLIAVLIFSIAGIFFSGPIMQALNEVDDTLKTFIAGTKRADVGQIAGVQPPLLPRTWFQPKNLPPPGGTDDGVPYQDLPPEPLAPYQELQKEPLAAYQAPERGVLDSYQEIPRTDLATSPLARGDTDTGGAGPNGRGTSGPEGSGGPDAGTSAGGAGGKSGSRAGAKGEDDEKKNAGAGGRRGGSGADDEGPAKISGAGRSGGEDGSEVVYNESTGLWERKPAEGDGGEAESVDKEKNGPEGKKAKGENAVDDGKNLKEESTFDWLTALKVAILLLLLIFVAYIAIGSSRRRRDE